MRLPSPKLILIILAVVVLITGGLLAFWFTQGKKPATNTNTNQAVNVANTNTTAGNTNVGTNTNSSTTNTNAGEAPGIDDDTDQQSLIRLSKLVVDRYGTFSNRNNFQNITSLEPYMTDAFQQSSAKYISEHQNTGVAEDFYGITTSALTADIVSYTKGKAAVIDVGSRRVETKTGQEQYVYTAHALVRFQSVEGNWKVNAVEWQ